MTFQIFFRVTMLFCFVLPCACSAKKNTAELILVGSTPGDEPIKSMLSIPASTTVDFIRWNLEFSGKHNFTLEIAFGESQPNTLGFKNGGQKQTITGNFTVSKNEKSAFREIYHLTGSGLPGISLVKINDNLFHVLTKENELMPGNGGWSYSLNRKNPVHPGEISISSSLKDRSALQMIFEGRTPCQEIAADHPEMNASPSCFKLKWRLVLNRDSVNHLPTTYSIRKLVDNVPRDITGKWTIINGTPANPGAIFYRIDPVKPAETILLLVGDDNVLFFLDKNNEPYTGNDDFSFTLNKKIPAGNDE